MACWKRRTSRTIRLEGCETKPLDSSPQLTIKTLSLCCTILPDANVQLVTKVESCVIVNVRFKLFLQKAVSPDMIGLEGRPRTSKKLGHQFLILRLLTAVIPPDTSVVEDGTSVQTPVC